jgi:hypothetical protein
MHKNDNFEKLRKLLQLLPANRSSSVRSAGGDAIKREPQRSLEVHALSLCTFDKLSLVENSYLHWILSEHILVSLLLLNLSSNNQNRTQNNTVVVQQKEIDRVGFEPTT